MGYCKTEGIRQVPKGDRRKLGPRFDRAAVSDFIENL